MRILKALWNLFAGRKSGFGLQFLTGGRPSYGALIASAKVARRFPNLPYNHRLFLILVASFLSSSCGSPSTRPDPAPAYSDGGYRSVEFGLCGKYFFGVGGCHYTEGVSAVDFLTVQGFYQGEISVISDLCHVEWKTRYKMNEAVQVQLSDLLGVITLTRKQSCTLRVIVSPDPIKNSEEKVYPRVGEIYVEVRSPGVQGLDLPSAEQVRWSEQPDSQGLQLPMTSDGDYLLTRCSEGNVQRGFQSPLLTFDPLERKSSCKYQYFIKTVDGKKFSQVYLRNVFSKDAILLPRPAITREKDKICISADPNTTTFLAIDSEWTNKSSLCANGKGPFKVRVFTTKRNYYELVK